MYTIQQNLELEKPVKLVKHVVSFIGIGKELAENRRSCHQVPVASIAESSLLRLRNWQVRFQVQLLCFSLRFLNLFKKIVGKIFELT